MVRSLLRGRDELGFDSFSLGETKLGFVVGQAPLPGAVVPTGSTVNIVIADGTHIIGLFPIRCRPGLPSI